jgi:DNA polymerase III sliding clamp (beta) subunit (PCNA family)
MKFEIFRNYLVAGLGRISAALDNSDIGSLVGIKVEKDGLYLSVHSDNLACQVKLDAKSDGDNILKIINEGNASVPGKMLIDAISSLEGKSNLSIEFEPAPADAQVDVPVVDPDDAETDEEPKEKTIGQLSIRAERGKDFEEVGLSCVERKVTVTMPSNDPAIVIKAAAFKDYYKKVGVSAGKANMAAELANVSISAKDGSVTMVTTNGQQLSLAKFEAEVKKAASVLLPYDILAKAVGMLGGEEGDTVSIQLSEGKPVCAFVSQPLRFLNKENGEARYKITSISDAFPNFDRVLSKLSWIATCRINKAEMEQSIKSFDVFEQVRTRLELSKDRNEIGLRKVTDKGKAKRFVSVNDLVFPNGNPQDIDMDVSSRHLSLGISTAIEDNVTLKMSGKSTMAKFDLGKGLEFYFQPFK